MKLNKNAIKDVINYVIEKQTFDLDAGQMTPIQFTSIVKDLSNKDQNKMEEVSYAIVCCINEGLVLSHYPRQPWGSSGIMYVTFKGFEWIDNN